MNFIESCSHARFYSILYILFIGSLNTTQTDVGLCQKSKYVAEYLSQYLTNLMHKFCFAISFISCLYMFRAHVLETRDGHL